MVKITSIKNSKISNILDLLDSKKRNISKKFIIEGLREIKLAIESNYNVIEILICSDFIPKLSDLDFQFLYSNGIEIIEISKHIFEKIAYRENKDGLIAIVETQSLTLDNLALSLNPLIIVLESIEKPGNLGAILRTADAANVDAVVVCDQKTDFYNPNVIRSSIGCVFTNQFVMCSTDEAIAWLQKKKIRIVSAALADTSTNCYSCNFQKPTAIAFGSEAFGLSQNWISASDEVVKIPMYGKIDSMNVSVSCAILIYEAVRQRIKM